MLTDKAKEIISGVKSKMEDSVLFLEEDLKTYRVGKANPSILNNVTVDYYGFTPSNNGEVIRCPVPPLTEERRKELIKKAKATGENIKVAVRNARRDGVDALKKAEKAGEFSEDVRKEGEDEIQKVTDAKVKAVDELVSAKEKEILTV